MHVRFASVRFLAAPSLTALAIAACGPETAATGAEEPAAALASADASQPARATESAPPTGVGDGSRTAQPVGAASADDAGASDGAPVFALCSDGQILAILAAESEAQVDLASSVRARVQGASALDLAEKILTDDSVLGIQVRGEARETGIAPVPGGIDRAIDADALDQIQALDAESGAALDASYVDREVLSHLRALGLIDRLLIPSVHDPRVGALVARVRVVVAQHTQAAFQAQATLEGSCGGP